MEISNDVFVLLDRCRAMNCIYEGQSFSRKLFSGVFGTPDRSDLVVEEMVEKGLVMKNSTGAYSLTSLGATELKSAAKNTKQHAFAKRQAQSRPPINSV